MTLFALPKDDQGWDPWDYMRAIVGELRDLNGKDDKGGELDETLTRFVPFQVNGDGVLTTLELSITVPAGVRWKPIGFAVSTSDASDLQSIRVYRNLTDGSGLLDVIPATLQGAQAKAPAFPVTLGENTKIIVRARAAAAPAATVVVSFVLAVEQTRIGEIEPETAHNSGEF